MRWRRVVADEAPGGQGHFEHALEQGVERAAPELRHEREDGAEALGRRTSEDGQIALDAQRGLQERHGGLHVRDPEFKSVPEGGAAGHGEAVDAEVADALNTARAKGGRIVAVGSTSLRLLETAAAGSDRIKPFSGETASFITPGYRFRAVDLMLTNFHLPRSTLFMLVAAFSGLDTMKRAYAHAIAAGYRFYSYGDACLLYPVTP